MVTPVMAPLVTTGVPVARRPPAGGAENWYEAVKAHVTSRMHLAPVFTRKLALMPFDLSNPVWVEDEAIDLEYHVRHAALPWPGGERELGELVGRGLLQVVDHVLVGSNRQWPFGVVELIWSGVALRRWWARRPTPAVGRWHHSGSACTCRGRESPPRLAGRRQEARHRH